MSTTTPGFTIAERTWIGFDPGSSLWAQQFPFLIGIAGVVAIFFLVRYWGLARWLALTAAFVVAVSPVAAQYSTHTKEYSTDFLLACFVLWRCEAARRLPATRQLAILAVGSGAALLISASVAPVVVGAWGAVLVCNLGERDARRRIVVAGTTVAVFLGGLYALLFRNLTPVLHRYWADGGAFSTTRRSVRSGTAWISPSLSSRSAWSPRPAVSTSMAIRSGAPVTSSGLHFSSSSCSVWAQPPADGRHPRDSPCLLLSRRASSGRFHSAPDAPTRRSTRRSSCWRLWVCTRSSE